MITIPSFIKRSNRSTLICILGTVPSFTVVMYFTSNMRARLLRNRGITYRLFAKRS